jgi:hypothetical protein
MGASQGRCWLTEIDRVGLSDRLRILDMQDVEISNPRAASARTSPRFLTDSAAISKGTRGSRPRRFPICNYFTLIPSCLHFLALTSRTPFRSYREMSTLPAPSKPTQSPEVDYLYQTFKLIAILGWLHPVRESEVSRQETEGRSQDPGVSSQK